MDLHAYPDALKVCFEASTLHPSDKPNFESRRLKSQEEFKQIAKVYADRGFPFEEQKRYLAFGCCHVNNYPWLGVEYRFRDKKLISLANRDLKKASKSAEIKPSSIGGPIKRSTPNTC